MRISDCWISICLNPNHLYVDCLSFSMAFNFQTSESSETTPTPRKPAFEWVRCGGPGRLTVASQKQNVLSSLAWFTFWRVFFLSLVWFSELGVQNGPHRQGKKQQAVFCVPCPWEIFLFCWGINQSRGFASAQSLHSPSTEANVFSGHAPHAKPSLPLEQFPGKPPARSAGKWSSQLVREQTTTNQSLACCDCTKFER